MGAVGAVGVMGAGCPSVAEPRNNTKISGSQQDYLVGKSGSPQIYLVVGK